MKYVSSEQRVRDLATAFDQVFAKPLPGVPVPPERLLRIRLGKDTFAIRTSELSSVLPWRRVAPVPSSVPELLGIAGIRGRLVPVYELALFVGMASRSTNGRWLALCGTEDPLALAFDELDGYFEAVAGDLHAMEAQSGNASPISFAVRTQAATYGVISLTTIASLIRTRGGQLAKEASP